MAKGKSGRPPMHRPGGPLRVRSGLTRRQQRVGGQLAIGAAIAFMLAAMLTRQMVFYAVAPIFAVLGVLLLAKLRPPSS